MAKYENSVIFFLDILGFKEIIKKNQLSVDEILEIFKITESELDYTKWIKQHYKIKKKHYYFKYLQVSDSIILSFPLNTPSGLYTTMLDIMRLQAHLIYKYNILLRGGCTIGNLYHNNTTIFGQAMSDVVEMEKKANFPRIIIPKKVILECSKYSSVGNKKTEEKKEIKSCLGIDSDGFYYIDYISYNTYGTEVDIPEDWILYMHKLKENIKKGLAKYKKKNNVLEKYKWLKEKYNQAIRQINQENLYKFNLQEIKNGK